LAGKVQLESGNVSLQNRKANYFAMTNRRLASQLFTWSRPRRESPPPDDDLAVILVMRDDDARADGWMINAPSTGPGPSLAAGEAGPPRRRGDDV